MKVNELIDKDINYLEKELKDLLRAQFGLRMQIATQQLTNTSQIKKIKKDIARIKTVISVKGSQK